MLVIEADDTLGQCIIGVSFGGVGGLEVRPRDTSEDLPTPSLEAPKEGLDQLVACHPTLAIDELDEELALP